MGLRTGIGGGLGPRAKVPGRLGSSPSVGVGGPDMLELVSSEVSSGVRPGHSENGSECCEPCGLEAW